MAKPHDLTTSLAFDLATIVLNVVRIQNEEGISN
jgi:hypothetical protein